MNPVAVVKPALTRTLQKVAAHVIYRPKGKSVGSKNILNLKQFRKSKASKG